MNQTMQVLQILKPGQAMWQETAILEPAPDEVLVKVAAVTTCPHWDMHIMAGEPMFPGGELTYPYPPGQPGHEMTGEIVALGADVKDFSVGTRVAAWRDPGKVRQGCYAQYVPFKAAHLLEVPESLAPQEVASLELAMCVQVAFNQLNQVNAVQGKTFGVSGLGSAGLIAVQMAQIYGATQVIALDPLASRRALARNLGADVVLSPYDDPFPAGPNGTYALEGAIDCTGLKGSIEFLMKHTKDQVLVFGVLREAVSFGFDQWRSGLNLMGYAFHNRLAAEQALELVITGKLALTPLATHELPLSQYAQGVDLLRQQEAVKVRFLPWA